MREGEPFGVHLVTPNSSNANNVRNVNSDGTLNNNNAYNGNRGVRPLRWKMRSSRRKPKAEYYKVQVGAFSKKANAEAMLAKLKAVGYSDAFITTGSGGTAAAFVKAGSKVRLKQGAKTYDGKSLASFVYNRDHIVKEIKGDRAVITYGGVVVAAVRLSDLTLV